MILFVVWGPNLPVNCYKDSELFAVAGPEVLFTLTVYSHYDLDGL